MTQEIVLIALDRDGTIDIDPGYLGRDDNWKEQFEFYPGVVEGLKLLKKDTRVRIIVATNQAGVARGYLTTERVQEINDHIDKLLKEQEIIIDDWQFCPYVPLEYSKKKGFEPNQWVKDSPLRKPGTGMLEASAQKLGFKLDDCSQICFIGDKLSDVQTGFNAGGTGILIKTGEYKKSYDEFIEFKKANPGNIFEADNFPDAVKIVLGLIKKED